MRSMPARPSITSPFAMTPLLSSSSNSSSSVACGVSTMSAAAAPRRRAIEHDANAELTLVGDALDEGADARAIAAKPLQCARVAGEDGEQLHRQHRVGAAERFNHLLVRDGRA